jgi:molybdenum cofactor cytidylyltransferase
VHDDDRDVATPSADGGTVAVVLAAGAGSRFAGPTHKLLAPLRGRPLVEHAVAAAVAAAIGPVVVVTGAVALPSSIATMSGVTELHHPGWADGQATSLAAAVAEARRRGADAIVVGLGDQPFVEPDAWRAVAASAAPIAIATYAGRRRNPVRLHRSVWSSLPAAGDEGARSLVRLRPELVEEVPCPGSPDDIDTVSDLEHTDPG